MTGTDDGTLPGTPSGNAYAYSLSWRVLTAHLTGRRCPQCPPLPEDFHLGQKLPEVCQVFVDASAEVVLHRQHLRRRRAANQAAAGQRDPATAADR